MRGKRDGNRENEEQENHSLNPLANPPHKTSEKCKASRAILKGMVDLSIAFFFLNLSPLLFISLALISLSLSSYISC